MFSFQSEVFLQLISFLQTITEKIVIGRILHIVSGVCGQTSRIIVSGVCGQTSRIIVSGVYGQTFRWSDIQNDCVWCFWSDI